MDQFSCHAWISETPLKRRRDVQQVVSLSDLIKTLSGGEDDEVEGRQSWWLDTIHRMDYGRGLDKSGSTFSFPLPISLSLPSPAYMVPTTLSDVQVGCTFLSRTALSMTRDEYGDAICLESVLFNKE